MPEISFARTVRPSDEAVVCALLARVADRQLHAALQRGETVNGACDLQDLLEDWLEFQDLEARTGFLTRVQRERILALNASLQELAGQDEADWWFFADDPPQEWHRAVDEARSLLDQIDPRALTLWRAAGHPVWGV